MKLRLDVASCWLLLDSCGLQPSPLRLLVATKAATWILNRGTNETPMHHVWLPNTFLIFSKNS